MSELGAEAPARSLSTALVEQPDDELAALRALLLRPERAELESLRERLENTDVRTQDVSRVLAEAIVLRAREDDELRRALQPVFVQAMRTAVREDPQFIIDAIYPVIGAAIRKAIANALREFMRGLNTSLKVFSLRRLKWRWEAWRTGVPLAEVVLRHTLVYRVEQVFLIHRPSGLVLQHVTRPEVEHEDPEMVGSMLSAIEEYMRDSFGAGTGETLGAFEVGELSVWIEEGPRAAVAAVVRGVAPAELRSAMQETLEHVHGALAEQLAGFTGDTAPFSRAKPDLEACLLSS